MFRKTPGPYPERRDELGEAIRSRGKGPPNIVSPILIPDTADGHHGTNNAQRIHSGRERLLPATRNLRPPVPTGLDR